ncbi:MAG TPA: hypothetical protein IAA08_04220 [Candidatus Eubacterium avistercoris]|uniref:Uncharacterized protein n=1 Tax=Candidatus Eubacterium avistercoris TaxID=2838567 RepID=A0A9D2D255_9FIRM|nr:hypothetical protein [Candidatus Eubacterium avistercoris]
MGLKNFQSHGCFLHLRYPKAQHGQEWISFFAGCVTVQVGAEKRSITDRKEVFF